MKMEILLLTCANNKEAGNIAKSLLKNKLIVCAKRTPVSSSFFWENSIDSEEEVLLIMETKYENFEKVEKEVKKLHSYDTFVLVALPVTKMSKGVKKWMKEGLK